MPQPKDKDKDKTKSDKARKRTWRPPSFQTGTLFESNSLACGKEVFNEMCQQGQGGGIKAS
jgi:hypothetical protein